MYFAEIVCFLPNCRSERLFSVGVCTHLSFFVIAMCMVYECPQYPFHVFINGI